MNILCTGMMVCDTLLSPVPSDILKLDSVSISRPAVCCGGDALNVALGLARLDVPVSIIGRIARDASGNFILGECARYGVDTSKVVYDGECATAASFALIDRAGERHFLTDKAIFSRLCGEDVSDEAIREADMVYFGSAMAMKLMDAGGIRDMFSRAHRLGGKGGRITAMDAAVNIEDPDRDWMSYLSPAFEETDIFFPSLGEAEKLTGKRRPEEIAECFGKFSMKIFGIKLGGDGCFITDFRQSRYIACPKNMPVVDTTGAGDSFMAGLLCGLSHGWDSFRSAEFAVCVASKNVGAVGGTSGIPDFEEAVKFYETHRQRDI